MCDMVATSVMYIGLTLTYASSFQMLRGGSIGLGFMTSCLHIKHLYHGVLKYISWL